MAAPNGTNRNPHRRPDSHQPHRRPHAGSQEHRQYPGFDAHRQNQGSDAHRERGERQHIDRPSSRHRLPDTERQRLPERGHHPVNGHRPDDSQRSHRPSPSPYRTEGSPHSRDLHRNRWEPESHAHTARRATVSTGRSASAREANTARQPMQERRHPTGRADAQVHSQNTRARQPERDARTDTRRTDGNRTRTAERHRHKNGLYRQPPRAARQPQTPHVAEPLQSQSAVERPVSSLGSRSTSAAAGRSLSRPSSCSRSPSPASPMPR